MGAYERLVREHIPDGVGGEHVSAIAGSGAIRWLVLPDAGFLHDPEPSVELVPGEGLREAVNHVEEILLRWARRQAEYGDTRILDRRIHEGVGEPGVECDQTSAFLAAEVDQTRIGTACQALLMNGGDVVAVAP